MSTLRVYLPLTADLLQTFRAHRRLEGPVRAHAVTEAVRRSDPDGDAEDWEHAVLQDAATTCLEQGGPVVVAAADVETRVIDAAAATGSRVDVLGWLELPRVASFHLGDDLVKGVELPMDSDRELELSWYDVTELDTVADLVGPSTR